MGRRDRSKQPDSHRAVACSDGRARRRSKVTDPEKKRKIIGNTFIEVFEEEALKVGSAAEFLLQGTLYPDVIESVSFKGPSATIKTHHNVGGLLPNMKLKLIEPLRELFKGTAARGLGAPRALVSSHTRPLCERLGSPLYRQTRSATSASCSAWTRRACGATPSPARAWPSASWARSRARSATFCGAPTPSTLRRSARPASTARSARVRRRFVHDDRV